MIVIMMMMIIIIIIGLRNEKRHNGHPYISQPNIRTIKSRKMNLGESFMYGEKQEIALL
jgi:hypothetical protein